MIGQQGGTLLSPCLSLANDFNLKNYTVPSISDQTCLKVSDGIFLSDSFKKRISFLRLSKQKLCMFPPFSEGGFEQIRAGLVFPPFTLEMYLSALSTFSPFFSIAL